MTEIQNENNEITEQILVLEKTIIEKIQAQGEKNDKKSVIRFSKDHWVEVDERNCLSATKFHPEYLTDNFEELEAKITYPQHLPYCTNIIFTGEELYIQDQIITRTKEGFHYLSTREKFAGLPIETTPHIMIDDVATVLKYYQSLNELIDKKLSKASEIAQTLES